MNLKKKPVKALLEEISHIIKENGSDEAYIDASLIIMKVLNFSRIMLYSHNDYVPDENEMRKLCYFTEKLKEGCPVRYLTGSCEFMGLEFFVNESTLIPRADTEILVETVLERTEKKGKLKGLDIGCGSGCIAVSLVRYNGNLDMTASDISIRALDTAKWNAYENGVELELVKSDLFENIEGKYDFIVSNPPYIRHDVIATLEPKVRLYEPVTALDGGRDGLDFYRKIIKSAPDYLKSGGMLAFEIGYDQGRDVYGLMEQGGFADIALKQDLAGLDRVVLGYIGEAE